MRRRKVDNKLERQLLIALIVSKDFLGQAAVVLEKELQTGADMPLFRLIADWCVGFFEEYKDAPKAHIETIYHSWADENEEDDLVDSVHDLLEDLSGDYENANDLNVPFLLDQLSKFLSKRKLTDLQEELDGLLSRGDTSAAAEVVTAYRSVELGQSTGIDPFSDKQAWKRAFAERAQPLIAFPGAAGHFFNDALTRDSLVAIQAPEKRGKTWWGLEFVIRALRQRKKVAYFQVGDLSESESMLRIGVRLAGIPLLKKECKNVKIPDAIERDKDDEEYRAEISYKEVDFDHPISMSDIIDARKKFLRACGISPEHTYMKVSIHPNSTINVRGISAILDQWAYEHGFVADVIVIDYADILAPEENKKEGRDMINDTWKALKRLSQERHALVITMTQASAAAYDAQTQGMKHFSNDKRKLAHVNGMFALNQTADEKEAQLMRLNWIVLRGAAFNIKRCLFVGYCFTLGRACCVATL